MTLRRALTGGLFVLLVAAVSPVASASAEPGYPPGEDATLAVSATAVGVGATITVTGAGFPPGSVSITSDVVAQGFARFAPASEALDSFRADSLRAESSARGVQRLAVAACSTGVTCFATADAGGAFSVPFTLTRAGTTVITASGGGVVESQTVQVGAGTGAGDDGSSDDGGVSGLPDTGSNLKTPLLLGGVLVLLGGGAAVLSRRRKRHTPVTS